MADPGPVNLTACIVCLVIIVILEDFIYLCRAALMALPETRAQELLESEKKSVQRLIRHKDDVFLSMSFGSIFLTLLFAAIAMVAFGLKLADAIGTLIGSILIVCLAEALIMMSVAGIVPRKIGRKRPVGVLKRFAAPALVFYWINRPAVVVSNAISLLITRMTGIDHMKEEDNITEAEILSMVDSGEESGTIENGQSEYIKNIFAFDDVFVSDLMTHRTDVTAVETGCPVQELNRVAQEEGYSRIPVYEEDIDNIVGIAYIKDLLPYVGKEMTTHIKASEIMRKAFYVPETMRCDKLFRSMNEKHVQMAVAVDEYGGTAGIISPDDILELIFGPSVFSRPDAEPLVVKKGPSTWEIDARANLDEVSREIGVDLEAEDADRLAGWVAFHAERLPHVGQEIFADGCRVTVLKRRHRRVTLVRLEVVERPGAETDEEILAETDEAVEKVEESK